MSVISPTTLTFISRTIYLGTLYALEVNFMQFQEYIKAIALSRMISILMCS